MKNILSPFHSHSQSHSLYEGEKNVGTKGGGKEEGYYRERERGEEEGEGK